MLQCGLDIQSVFRWDDIWFACNCLVQRRTKQPSQVTWVIEHMHYHLCVNGDKDANRPSGVTRLVVNRIPQILVSAFLCYRQRWLKLGIFVLATGDDWSGHFKQSLHYWPLICIQNLRIPRIPIAWNKQALEMGSDKSSVDICDPPNHYGFILMEWRSFPFSGIMWYELLSMEALLWSQPITFLVWMRRPLFRIKFG